jgi:phenylacetate-CoA ligase
MAHCLRGQADYAYRPLSAIQVDRDRRVRRMAEYAYRFVPYYRETMQRLSLRPSDFQSADDLAQLPLLQRSQLQRDPQYYVSTEKRVSELVAVQSSGTSGQRCTFFLDGRTLCQYAAHDARARAVFAPLLDKPWGYRQTKIGSPLGPAGSVQKFYDTQTWLPPEVALRRQELSVAESPEVNIRLIDRFRPDVIRSFGSYLAMLFHGLRASGLTMHQPKVLRYTADMFPDSARNLIEREFGIPVFGTYDATEAYNIAFECEQRDGLHLNVDLCPVRIVDAEGKTSPPGQSGAVVISNLISRGTVFLNYALDDVAATSLRACACGRSLPLLQELQGRISDWVELPSGEWVHAVLMAPLTAGNKGLWQFQFVQESPLRLSVLLVCSPDCPQEATRERILTAVRATVGPDMTVDVQFVDEVQRTAAGKSPVLISRCTRGRTPRAMTYPAWTDRPGRSPGATC